MPQTTSSQNSRVELVTSANQHWYKSGKKKDLYYPSVTTYLSVWPKGLGFERYLANQESWETSQEILRRAGERGSNVHMASELLEQGRTLSRESYTIEEWEQLMSYVKWRKDFGLVLEEVEFPVISEKLKTGGTIDRIFSHQETIYLIDLKTSTAIHGNYFVQAATYAEMYEEKTKKVVDMIGILRLAPRRREGYEYKTMTRDEWKQEVKTFKAVQHIWNHINPNAKPRLLELPTTLSL